LMDTVNQIAPLGQCEIREPHSGNAVSQDLARVPLTVHENRGRTAEEFAATSVSKITEIFSYRALSRTEKRSSVRQRLPS
jgi:hypothetical protein